MQGNQSATFVLKPCVKNSILRQFIHLKAEIHWIWHSETIKSAIINFSYNVPKYVYVQVIVSIDAIWA